MLEEQLQHLRSRARDVKAEADAHSDQLKADGQRIDREAQQLLDLGADVCVSSHFPDEVSAFGCSADIASGLSRAHENAQVASLTLLLRLINTCFARLAHSVNCQILDSKKHC